jgi:hypothetical protein
MEIITIKKGAAKTFSLPLVTYGGTDWLTGVVLALGDVQIQKDAGAYSSIPLGQLSIVDDVIWIDLLAADTDFDNAIIRVKDQDVTKVFEDSGAILSTEISTTLSTIEAAVLPQGNRTVTIHVQDGAAAPIPDVFVRVADATGTITIATGTTDTGGDYVLSLDDDTYQVILRKAFVNFTVPEALVVAGDTTDTYVGTSIAPSAPTQPDTCVVYGVVIDVKGDPVLGAEITAVETDNTTFANTQKIVQDKQTTSDATGYWELELIRSSALDPADSPYEVTISFRGFKYKTTVTVPDQNSAEFSTLAGT